MNDNPNQINELKESVAEYNNRVNAKLRVLESDLDALVAENERLVIAKDGQVAEKNVCILTIAHLAEKLGYQAGIKKVYLDKKNGENNNETANEEQFMIVADFPTGQVSWNINESDLGLFDTLSEYAGEWTGQSVEQSYGNIFNWVNGQF